MLYVGIDWASDHHDVCLTNDSTQTLAAFRIAPGSQGFECLHRVIKEHQAEPPQVLVAQETSRGLLVHELLRAGNQFMPSIPKPSAVTNIATWCRKPKAIRSMLPVWHTCSRPTGIGSRYLRKLIRKSAPTQSGPPGWSQPAAPARTRPVADSRGPSAGACGYRLSPETR
ncbi:MAG: transposase [Acidobacteriota bacterium]